MNELAPISNIFSTLIASREFELFNCTSTEKVTVEIGTPVNDVETVSGYDWRCPIKIIIGSEIINDRACGVDSFQALSIAMNQLIKLRLETIAQEKEAIIRLYGEEYDFEL